MKGRANDAPTRRLTKEDRRDQLLGAATKLVVERGVSGLTMERLAEYADVSKALPYLHFANAEEVLAALHETEIAYMGERLVAAVEAADGTDERIEAVVHAYFDVVAERGAILAVILTPVVTNLIPDDAHQRSRAFVVDLMKKIAGIDGKSAIVLADVIANALAGAVGTWARGDVSRRTAERAVTQFIVAGVRDAMD